MASLKNNNKDHDSKDNKNSNSNKKNGGESSPKREKSLDGEETKSKIDLAKKDCTNLKRKVTRLFKKCVEEIKKMTSENLPVKSKKGGKSKVSIIVPEGKKTGDKISFK